MQVDELLDLTRWIATEIDEGGIVGLYNELKAKLEQNAQANQPQQPFGEEKENLVVALAAVRTNVLTSEQVRFLDCLGIAGHVGPSAVRAVEDVLFRNPLDPSTAATRVDEARQSIAEGVARSQRLAEDLEGCVARDEALGEDVLVRVRFAGETAIRNTVDLRKWADTWHGIVRGITMAHNQSPEDVRVIGAGRGSLLFDLATPYEFALTVTGIVFASLKVAERVVKIRHEAQMVKSLQLSNKKVARDLEAEAKAAEEKGAEQVTAEFTAQLKIDPASAGDVTAALGKSVADLIGFLRRGGEVDCVFPDQAEEGEGEQESRGRDALATTLEQIRELEGRLRQLGTGEADEPEE
jgi:hypothetical protein